MTIILNHFRIGHKGLCLRPCQNRDSTSRKAKTVPKPETPVFRLLGKLKTADVASNRVRIEQGK